MADSGVGGQTNLPETHTVLLGEPPPSPADLHFRLLGIPVRVHPFFWLVALLLGLNLRDPIHLLVWVVAVFIGILVHEMGHALMMRAFGLHPWITLYGLGGLTAHNPALGAYGRASSTTRQVLIFAAGPAAGFALAALLIGVLKLAGKSVSVAFGLPFGCVAVVRDVVGSVPLTGLLNNLLFISIAWGVINLMPVYPLDGGQIVREVLLAVNPRGGIEQSLVISLVTAAALAVYGITAGSLFMLLMFGYLAYGSYVALQAYRHRGPW